MAAPFQVRLQHVAHVMQVDGDVVDFRFLQPVEYVVDDRLSSGGHQRLGAVIGIGAQARAFAGGQNEGVIDDRFRQGSPRWLICF